MEATHVQLEVVHRAARNALQDITGQKELLRSIAAFILERQT
jgi:hypothetical protein